MTIKDPEQKHKSTEKLTMFGYKYNSTHKHIKQTRQFNKYRQGQTNKEKHNQD